MRLSTICFKKAGLVLLVGVITPAVSTANNYVLTLSGGPAWANPGKDQTILLQPNIIDGYTANDHTDVVASGELFAGLQHSLSQAVDGQLGIAVSQSGPAKLSGSVLQDASSMFNNFSYNYKISSTRVALKGKLSANPIISKIVQPYVSASVGVGINRAYAYSSTPYMFEDIPEPAFANHTEAAFAYTVGVGFQKQFNENWQLGVGYEFADWGRAALGRAAGQSLNTGLSTNHLYSNQVQLNLSYIF